MTTDTDGPRFDTSFQEESWRWVVQTFGPQTPDKRGARGLRFIEEALELVQATGLTAEKCHQMVDYVFGRPVGEVRQEIGGTFFCMLMLAQFEGIDADDALEEEIGRAWSKQKAIREKHAAKPEWVKL